MAAKSEKPNAVLVGVFGAGPLFNDLAKKRKNIEHYRRKGAWR
jgi:hypothetical protein